MSHSELDIFNIETSLIESNSMDSLQNSLNELVDIFPMSEDMIEMVKILMYKQYYTGRIDSNKYIISGLKDYVNNNPDYSDDHSEVILYVLKLSNDQLN